MAQDLGINYSTAKTILRIWKKEKRIFKKYSSTSKRKRPRPKIRSLLEKCNITSFTIQSDKCESTSSNSSVSQPVDIINLICMYNSYNLIKSIMMTMVESDKLTLSKLLSICELLVKYINNDVSLLNGNHNLTLIYERLIGNFF